MKEEKILTNEELVNAKWNIGEKQTKKDLAKTALYWQYKALTYEIMLWGKYVSKF